MRTEIIGDATLILGDCLEALRTVHGVNAIVTDPPYTAAGGNSNGRSSSYDAQYWRFWFKSVWGAIVAAATPETAAFMFCDWRMVGPLAEAVAGEEKVRAEQWRVSQANRLGSGTDRHG